MKYYTMEYAGQRIHVTEIEPSKGYLTLTKGNGLQPVKDMRHPWIIENKDVNEVPAVSINCSFFNADGTRNGHMMRDSANKWEFAPYGDTWANLMWDLTDLFIFTNDNYRVTPMQQWAVGVGSLVEEGKKNTSKTIVAGVAPRSAIGQKLDDTVVFVCTDDRPAGLTVDQTAELMLHLGCEDAAMLDGGGSSTMVVNGKTVNECTNRPVYDCIQFYSKELVKMPRPLIHPVNPSPIQRDFMEVDGRYISSPYGPRNTGDGFHDGVDYLPMIPYDEGEPIYATHDGVIARRYKMSRSYGNYLIIDGDNYSTLYAHLKDFNVKLGQSVKQGDIIGYMGDTGTTGVHLHFEYRDRTYKGNESVYWAGKNGEYYSSQNPLDYIAKDSSVIPVEKESTDKKAIEEVLKNIEGSIKTIRELMEE